MTLQVHMRDLLQWIREEKLGQGERVLVAVSKASEPQVIAT
jgi:hypothetical protein